MLDPLYGEAEREVGDSMPVFCTEKGGQAHRPWRSNGEESGHRLRDNSRFASNVGKILFCCSE